MFELFWELHQQSRIKDAQRQARQTESIARDTSRRIEELQDRIDHLAMINAAIWTLLQQRTGMSDQQLLDQVREIDLADGKLDGRMRKEARSCPKCHRAISPRHLRCVYCGEQVGPIDAFERVM